MAESLGKNCEQSLDDCCTQYCSTLYPVPLSDGTPGMVPKRFLQHIAGALCISSIIPDTTAPVQALGLPEKSGEKSACVFQGMVV